MSQVTPILVERRFPVGLEVSIAAIRDLYDESKTSAWNPQSDIDWSAFDVTQYSKDALESARLSWSRRAWVLYTGLAETPSVLVRFCVERGREADPKFFLTVRNTEEAWHIECCHSIAELCGGYIDAPTSDAYATFLNQSFHREVLHAETPLDAYFAAHCMIAEGLELALWEAYLDNASDVLIRDVLQRCVTDKRRHARFGDLYLEQRAPHWSSTEKKQIADYISAYIRDIELHGYQCASLATEQLTGDIVQADTRCASAGLGALAPDDERRVFARALQQLTSRLGVLDLAVVTPENALLSVAQSSDQ